jgi:hypothetical protein
MASIKTDQTVDGLRNDFEASATHLLPYDSVQKKRSDHAGGKRVAANISDTTGEKEFRTLVESRRIKRINSLK